MEITVTENGEKTSLEHVPTIACTPPEIAIAAANLLAEGKTPDEVVSTIRKEVKRGKHKARDKGRLEPSGGASREDVLKTLRPVYLLAYLRYATGQIEGLTELEMTRVACGIPKTFLPLEKWAINCGYLEE